MGMDLEATKDADIVLGRAIYASAPRCKRNQRPPRSVLSSRAQLDNGSLLNLFPLNETPDLKV